MASQSSISYKSSRPWILICSDNGMVLSYVDVSAWDVPLFPLLAAARARSGTSSSSRTSFVNKESVIRRSPLARRPILTRSVTNGQGRIHGSSAWTSHYGDGVRVTPWDAGVHFFLQAFEYGKLQGNYLTELVQKPNTSVRINS